MKSNFIRRCLIIFVGGAEMQSASFEREAGPPPLPTDSIATSQRERERAIGGICERSQAC